eukprot:scaffold403522_cov41-Prasinocladus_malaysianus.AAC.1
MLFPNKAVHAQNDDCQESGPDQATSKFNIQFLQPLWGRVGAAIKGPTIRLYNALSRPRGSMRQQDSFDCHDRLAIVTLISTFIQHLHIKR